jgi:hypothetical protein
MGFSLGLGAADLLGFGAADLGAAAGADVLAGGAADVIGADVLGAGAGDLLGAGATDAALAGGAGVGADLFSAAPLAADASGGLIGGGVADASLFAPTAEAAGALGGAGIGGDLLGLGVGADLGGLGVGADLGGLGAGGAGAELTGVTGLSTSSLLPASATATAPAAGGGTFSAGQALTAASDPSSILDLSGAGDLTGGAQGGQQFASLGNVASDASQNVAFEPLPNTNLGGGGGAAADAGGPDLTVSSDSSAIGGGGGPGGPAAAPRAPGDITGMGFGGPNNAPAAVSPASVPAPAAGGGAATGGGAAAGAGGGGGGGLFGLSNRDLLMGGLALGPLAYTMMKGEPGVPPQANQATALSPQEQALASQLMTSVQTNTPTPSQAAVVAQNTQNRINQARQALFNMGVQNPEADSRWPYMMQQIQQQQLVDTQQFMQQNMNMAMQAAGPAQQGLLSVAQMQAAQDQAYTNALSNAMRSAGTVLALGAGAKPTVNVGL